ncbi:LPXTG cell wall anchor domain-containing protein [Streptococcus loxodontisalivarius]|uniref:LPXTG-motif cell wall-anchored protein n=1 Tax=Streptococcus loxodontisalivarius TaxID=1349415 RepID=A0ABS2PRI0_9STRE|nr:LPXTG cell wall anchor domain-containing protein [Streptococcus loxodontisalivarius]MBM7642639.1 LPXTG-motif cell wall-anchored protein [Streptococcus loxodontisalivarius]
MKKKSYILGSVLVLALFAAGISNNQLAYAEDSQTESSQVTTVLETSEATVTEASEESSASSAIALDYLPANLQGTWENNYESDGQSYNVRMIVTNNGLSVQIKSGDQESLESVQVANIEQLAEGVYSFDITSSYAELNNEVLIGDVDYSQISGLVLANDKLYLQFGADLSADNWSKDYAFTSIDLSNVDYDTIDFPKELVGTWQASVSWGGNQNVQETYVISADGKVSKSFVDQNAGMDISEEMSISKVQKVGDNLYRLVAPDGSFLEGGIGGMYVQYQQGFYLDGDVMKPVLWSSSSFEEMTYDNPSFGSEFTRVSTDGQAASDKTASSSNSSSQSSSSSSSSQASSSSAQKEDKSSNLPSTGETVSILGAVGLVILAAVGVYLLKKKKEK